MRRLALLLPLGLLLAAGCQLHVARDLRSPADEARCDPGVAGQIETGLQIAGRKTERSFRLVGHVLFESLLGAGNSVVGLFSGGPRKAAEAWEHGAKNVTSVARYRAEQVEDAGHDLCPAPRAEPAKEPTIAAPGKAADELQQRAPAF